MKKIYLLAVGFVALFTTGTKAQTVLLSEDFETTAFYNKLDSVVTMPGNSTDTMWYSYDQDMIPDGSGGNRPDGYFALQPFSVVDQYPTIYGGTPPDSNTVIGANSWNNNGEGTAGAESNYLVTCSVQLGSHDTLFWKSAPRQTPRYMDGYEVLLSTTTNDDLAFTHVLFTAAENISLGTDTTYSTFGFSPGFVHGQDGTYIDCACGNTSHEGQLRPFSAPLDAYAGQTVFIAFHHNSHDDNLIEFDDVMIRGTNDVAVLEKSNDINLSVFPNPATDFAQMNIEVKNATPVTINVMDITGKVIYTENMGTLMQGRHYAKINTADLAKGFYTVSVKTANSVNTTKLIVK